MVLVGESQPVDVSTTVSMLSSVLGTRGTRRSAAALGFGATAQLSCKFDVCNASAQVSHSSIGPSLGFGPDLRPETSWLPRHAALHYEADGRMISVTAARRNLFQPNCANLSLDPWDIVVSSILLWIVLGGVCFHREPMHQRIRRLGRHAPKSRNQVKTKGRNDFRAEKKPPAAGAPRCSSLRVVWASCRCVGARHVQ